jgi:hypothetical protein
MSEITLAVFLNKIRLNTNLLEDEYALFCYGILKSDDTE